MRIAALISVLITDQIGGIVTAATAKPRLLRCALLAFALAVLSFLGWTIGSARLAGFGFADYPNWPWAAVAAMILPFAFIAQVAGARKTARLLTAAPAAIAILSLLEYCGLPLPGFDRMLFPHAVAAFPLATPGRPGLIPTISILMGAASILLMERRGPSVAKALLLLNALTIGLNLMSATLLILGADVLRQQVRVAGSLPACFPPLILALGTFEWMADIVRQRMMPSASNEWRGGRFVLLFLIGLPAVMLPLLDQTEAVGWLPHIATEIIASTAYLVLVLLLLTWSLSRITHEHEAANILTRAIDTVPIIMTDRSGRITHWSVGCEALFGWSAAEAIGQRIDFRLRIGPSDMLALTPPSDGSGATLRDVVATRRDGSTVALRTQAARVGSVDAVGGTQVAIALTDTSSLRRAQADLEASEAKLQIAIEAHQIGIFDWDIVGDRIHWTLHAAIHHGATPGRPVDYARWSSLIDPTDLIRLEERREEALASRAPQYSFRYRVGAGEGHGRMIEGSTRVFYDEAGNPTRLLGVTVDVTDREERAVALEHREAQLRSIIATIPDAMIITARDGTIRHASDTAARMFDCAPSDIVDHPLASFILNRAPSDPWADTSAPATSAAMKLGTRNLMGRRANGEEFPVELVVAKTHYEQDSEFIAFVRDLSERQAEQARIDALSAEYAHFARLTAVGAMASTLAHELNQPLAACSNFLATARLLVKRGETGDRVGDMLKQANDQILRAGEIIRRTREFVAKNDGDVSVESLNPLIQEAVALGLTGNTDLRIRTRFRFEEGASEVVVDRIQIQQVIVNLIRNAAEALRGRRFGTREIDIATRAIEGETIEVTVHDNGPGIPKSLLDTIGSPFQSTKAGGSMGLGLSICRRIVEAHGGTLTAYNHDAGGAVFSFTIPSWSEPLMAEALR